MVMKLERCPHLPQIGLTTSITRFATRGIQGYEYRCRKDADDGDDNQELD
ncbi:MAG TPA: hypothetical protein VEA92_00900 [Candidatus Paceibacterota bacterium]|nr:hypothetical protein [Candidatus Paceibacterota bacterium]